MILRNSLLGVLLLLLLVGCGKPEDKFVGTYTGKFQLSADQMAEVKRMTKTPNGQPSQADEFIKTFNSITGKLTLNQDKTALLETTARGGTSKKGTWAFEGNQVVIKEEGKGADFSQHLVPSTDGKTLTYKEWTWTKS